MMKMQHILENIDLPDLFVASVEVIMQLSSLYPETLTEYFRVSAAFLFTGCLLEESFHDILLLLRMLLVVAQFNLVVTLFPNFYRTLWIFLLVGSLTVVKLQK